VTRNYFDNVNKYVKVEGQKFNTISKSEFEEHSFATQLRKFGPTLFTHHSERKMP
jgi:hypothetical protein